MVDDPPQPRVVFADQAGGCPHRHGLDERHHQRLEQQGEAAARSRPRHRDPLDAAALALDPGNAGVQVGLMLEEIEVTPACLLRVIGGTGGATARAGKAAAGGEIEVNIQPAPRRVELAAHHAPWRRQSQRALQQLPVLHPSILARVPDGPSLPACSRPSRARRRLRGGGLRATLDRRCARRPSRAQVGTEGWSFSRT